MKKLIRRSLCQLAILAFAAIAAADQPVVFFALSSDDNSLFRMTSNNLQMPVLLGEISTGTDLYGLIDLGEELLTLDRATDRAITIRKDDASVINAVQILSLIHI